MTTLQITREMGIGINLGNTLEWFGDWIWEYGDHTPISYETAWGSPEIDKEMIEGIKREGFGVMRISVHWFNMMEEDYKKKGYLERVVEVIDWAIDTKLYVILNIHHDENEFFKNMPNPIEYTIMNYRKILEQIDEAFKDYNDYLMLEALNEEACWNDVYNPWSDTNEEKNKFLFIHIN